MPQSLPDTTPPKRRFRWPTGMPQLAALLLVLLVDSLVAPHFWQVCFRMGVCSVALSTFLTVQLPLRYWRLV